MKNKSNTVQNVMNKENKKMKPSAKQKRTQAEANARRKIANRWNVLARGVKYQKAAAKESCDCLTQMLKTELFDGILLNLSERNGVKSYSCQKRILRRIVEKRQAQSVHRQVGRSDDRFAKQIQRQCVSKSWSHLQSYQQCA